MKFYILHLVRGAFFLILLPLFTFGQRCAFDGDIESGKKMMKRLLSMPVVNTLSVTSVEVKIPVVFHVITRMDLQTEITDYRIQNQVSVINADFNRLNPDSVKTYPSYKKISKGMNVKFVMATIDPNGKATTGVVRKAINKTFNMSSDDTYKDLSSWPSELYLNIWVIEESTQILGIGTFPDQTVRPMGVTLNHRSLFGGPVPYHLGRTLTHEIGHYFGMFHIWGDELDCSGTDLIDDTPPQAGATTDIPLTRELSCDPMRVRMYENYMDYTDDAGMNMFSADQVSKMNLVLTNVRKGLINNPATIPVPGGEKRINDPSEIIEIVVVTAAQKDPAVNQVKIYQDNHEVVIDLSNDLDTEPVMIYSIQGMIVAKDVGTCRISLAGQAAGIYIVLVKGIAKRVFNP